MNLFLAIFLLIISYLLGSIPSALIVGKLTKNIDIREYGSKNMGATNTFRVLGLKWGAVVFLCDALKAGLIVGLVNFNAFNLRELCFHPLIYGVVAIIGHLFPIFASFKGGKGVSSTGGVMIAYNPLVALICIIVFFISLAISKFVSLSSLIAASALTILSVIELIIIGPNLDTIIFFVICILVLVILVVRHRSNIKRLINHNESKITDSMSNQKK